MTISYHFDIKCRRNSEAMNHTIFWIQSLRVVRIFYLRLLVFSTREGTLVLTPHITWALGLIFEVTNMWLYWIIRSRPHPFGISQVSSYLYKSYIKVIQKNLRKQQELFMLTLFEIDLHNGRTILKK